MNVLLNLDIFSRRELWLLGRKKRRGCDKEEIYLCSFHLWCNILLQLKQRIQHRKIRY